MSIEYRKNEVKNKATDIYTRLHTNGLDLSSFTEVDKINYHLSQVLKILNKEV